MISQKLETKPSELVRDPMCGMEIAPASAFATRQNGAEIVYFCSEQCVQQYDHEQAVSATTGVSENGSLRWIELPLAAAERRRSAAYLKAQLSNLPGVSQVTVNPSVNVARVQYDPAIAEISSIVTGARSAGFTLGSATTRLGIQGMYCASCVSIIEQALGQTPGVLSFHRRVGNVRVSERSNITGSCHVQLSKIDAVAN